MKPVVIAVAITGSVPRKKDNPAVAGHASRADREHARGLRGRRLARPHPRPQPRRKLLLRPGAVPPGAGGHSKHCPGMIVQFSTGGRGRDPSARGSALYLKPDMASLSTGSVNFPTIVYENHTTLVEDLADKMKNNGVHAGDRDFRPLPYPRRAPAHRQGPHGRAPARAVRHGRAERHAGRRAPARHPPWSETRRVLLPTRPGRPPASDPTRPGDGMGSGPGRRRGADRAGGQHPGHARTGWPQSNAELVQIAAEADRAAMDGRTCHAAGSARQRCTSDPAA